MQVQVPCACVRISRPVQAAGIEHLLCHAGVQANPGVLCLPVLQARGFNEVFQLLRTVPRLNRATGSHSALMCSGGLFTDNIIRFDNERTQWEARCVVQI